MVFVEGAIYQIDEENEKLAAEGIIERPVPSPSGETIIFFPLAWSRLVHVTASALLIPKAHKQLSLAEVALVKVLQHKGLWTPELQAEIGEVTPHVSSILCIMCLQHI